MSILLWKSFNQQIKRILLLLLQNASLWSQTVCSLWGQCFIAFLSLTTAWWHWKMNEIWKWPAVDGLQELNLKNELEKRFLGIETSSGWYICSCHVQPLPNGHKRYSKYCHPILRDKADGLYWSSTSSCPLPLKRPFPTAPPESHAKKRRTKEEECLFKENTNLKEELKEMSEKIQTLEMSLKKKKEELAILLDHTEEALIDQIFGKIDSPEASMEWYSVWSFVSFNGKFEPACKDIKECHLIRRGKYKASWFNWEMDLPSESYGTFKKHAFLFKFISSCIRRSLSMGCLPSLSPKSEQLEEHKYQKNGGEN